MGLRGVCVHWGAGKKIRKESEGDEEHGASFPWRHHGNSGAGKMARCPSAVAAPRHRILTRPVRSGAN